MSSHSTDHLVLSDGETSDFISKLVIWGVMAAAALMIFGAVQALRFEITWRYLLFVVGGFLSILILFGLPIYVFSAVPSGRTRKPSVLGMVLTFSGFIPYLLGLYLVLYEGFWRLGELRRGFDMFVVMKAAVYVVLGYLIVKSIYNASSLARRVEQGKIVVQG